MLAVLDTTHVDRLEIEAGGFTTDDVITHFPSALRDLPDAHRAILAVLAASTELSAEPVPKTVLYRAIARLVASTQSSTGFDRYGLASQFSRVVGNLLDYGLVQSSGKGFSLTTEALEARTSWNGAFTRLVSEVRSIV
jgi:hypothetical protein